MKANEIVKKLRQTFDELQKVKAADVPTDPNAAPPAQSGVKAKLKDGTEIEISEIAVGGIVTSGGTPLPAGEYELEDGTKMVIGDNGAITEIKPKTDAAPSTPAPAPTSAPTSQGMSEMLYESVIGRFVKEEFGTFKTSTTEKFAQYENKFAEYEKKLAKATKVIEGLINLTQTLADTPTGEPDPVTKRGSFSKNNDKDKQENFDILFS